MERSKNAIGCAALGIGILGVGAYWFLREVSTYLIILRPAASHLFVDGRDVTQHIGEDGAGGFTLNGFYGSNRIRAVYPSGTVVEIEVFPRLGDDNSSSLTITPNHVKSDGDLRYREIHIGR